MRIAVTADPELPVPPTRYGGIERIVDMLVRGLVGRGHEVTLFAHPESDVPCRLEPYPGRQSQASADLIRNMMHVSYHVARGGFDVVHAFGRLAYLLPILPLRIPKVMSYQRKISPHSVGWGQRLARGSLHFAGCSRHLIRQWQAAPNWHVVYNAAPLDRFRFTPVVPDDAPLVFLGRVEEIKGPHVAIQVARASGRRLILAGNVPDVDGARAFFEREVRPHVDGKCVAYIGPVDDKQKSDLLGQAKALLMPILWDEPFGIVMAEALACGTPVVAFGRGSVPEVIRNGVNGIVCASIGEMVIAIDGLGRIDRESCRRAMEQKFSDRAMVDSYEALYRRIVEPPVKA